MLLITFSLIIIGEMLWITYLYESKTTLENQILKDAEQRNLMIINRIDSYVTDRTIDLINLSGGNSIEQAVISSNTEFQKMNNPRQYIEEQNVTWMSVPIQQITPIMKNIIENPTSDRLREVVTKEKAIYNTDVFGRILVANSYGADVAATVKPDDYDQFTDPWWVSAKENGLYLGGISYDKASGFVTIPISVRMDDNTGNFIGVMKGTITLDNIFKIISNQMESAKLEPLPSEYKIIDGSGMILYSTKLTDKPFVYVIPPKTMQKLKGQSGTFTQNDEDSGLPELITYARSTSSQINPTANWIFIVEYDKATALKPVTNMIGLSIIIMIISIPTVILVIFLISQKIEIPINKITIALNEFAHGKITDIPTTGTDETKNLALNFNNMTHLILKSQNEITNLEEKYRTMFQLSPDPIRVSNMDGIITDINDAYIREFGYSAEELVGKSIFVTIDKQSKEEVAKLLVELKNGRRFENIKAFYKRKDGTIFPVLLSVTMHHDANNNPIGHIAIIKNISKIIDYENMIVDEEKKIKEQYVELTQIDKQKNEFASMVSHELTTPLFPIKFHAEMLKDPKLLGILNEEQKKSIDEIYQNSIKLERLIRDILDAQKIDMHAMKFIKKTFEIDQFMENIIKINKPLMNNKQIQLVNTTQGKFHANSDPERLEQVFSNLIKNSVDFVDEKKGRIEIGAESQEDDILFYVKDNGVGIPKEKQANLFKKFYQIDTSITRKHRGSGLGLSICKGIVEGLGGKIWLESTVDLGTIIYFTIPKHEMVQNLKN